MKKINEVCSLDNQEGENSGGAYIDVTELELNVATKNRSVSMDVHSKRRAAT